MPTVKKTAAAPAKKPVSKKVETVSSGKATLGKPGAPKAKRAVKTPAASLSPIPKAAVSVADPLPGRVTETARLVGRITTADGFNDFTVAIIVPGSAEAIRYFGVQVDKVKGKRLTKELLADQVARLALHYEAIRTDSKFGRGYMMVTAVVVRQPKDGVKLGAYSFTYPGVEVTAM